MVIPKTVFQTWTTQNMPNKIKDIILYMKKTNPLYDFQFYTDEDIVHFLSTYSEDVDDNDLLLEIYSSIYVGAVKADFWRYLILYKYGGIYLDIDAVIVQPLENLFSKIENENNVVRENINAIITRETNHGVFNNWILCFAPKHPFMYMMIQHCISNLKQQKTTDVLSLTGPIAFTKMIYTIHEYRQEENETWDDYERRLGEIVGKESESESELELKRGNNSLYELTDKEFSYLFSFCGMYIYNKDMGEFARCKNRYSNLLYLQNPHWRTQLEQNRGSPFVHFT